MLTADFILLLSNQLPLPDVRTSLATMQRIGEADRETNDFVWRGFIRSLSTWGRDDWSGGSHREQSYALVHPDTLVRLNEVAQQANVDAFFRGHVRWASAGRCRNRIPQIFRHVVMRYGGVAEACVAARTLNGYGAKRDFLSTNFPLLLRGEKYGRNFWMDLHDVDFQDRFALDYRVIDLIRELDDLPAPVANIILGDDCRPPRAPTTPTDYAIVEQFLLQNIVAPMAQHVGLEISAWQVDRLMWSQFQILRNAM